MSVKRQYVAKPVAKIYIKLRQNPNEAEDYDAFTKISWSKTNMSSDKEVVAYMCNLWLHMCTYIQAV